MIQLFKRAAAAIAAVLVAAGGAQAQTGTPADVYEFVTAIAESTANARIGGDNQQVEKVITFGRHPEKGLVVTSIGVLADGDTPKLPDGTVAVAIFHYKGQCGPPHGDDDVPVTQGVATFVVAPSGRNIWEIGEPEGARSIRLVKGPGEFGTWEAYRADPKGYVVYKCAKYR